MFFVELVESADFNIGRNKVYFGVAANLFAFACKQSWDNGNYGHVAFNSKTNLIQHYKKSIGAKPIGNSNQMIIEPLEASELINKYYKTKIMGYIKEPNGVTLVVDKLKFTTEIEERIKEFIAKSKEKATY